jgi:hypothetical protein
LIPPPTIVSNNFQKPLAKSPNLQTTPVNVSIYSIDGRLVRKISNVKLETLDNTLASLNLHGGKVLFAVWNQNGMKCSKRIMNLRKNNF